MTLVTLRFMMIEEPVRQTAKLYATSVLQRRSWLLCRLSQVPARSAILSKAFGNYLYATDITSRAGTAYARIHYHWYSPTATSSAVRVPEPNPSEVHGFRLAVPACGVGEPSRLRAQRCTYRATIRTFPLEQ